MQQRTPDEIAEELGEAYDSAVLDLSIEDAIEVNKALDCYLTAALLGLREDQDNAAR